MTLALLLAAGALLNGAAAALAYRRRSLDAGGAAAGTIVGTAIFGFGGPLLWLVLVAFFVTATAASMAGRRDKESLKGIHEKGERRDIVQVLANGGLGALTAVAYGITRDPAWAAAFAVSFAASNADTWASEIGVLSRRPPVSVLTLRPVPRGISGGVTLLGSAAALGGSVLIGVVFALADLALDILPGGFLGLVVFVGAGGFAGSLLDSILGAGVQARYVTLEGSLTERSRDAAGRPNRLVHGLRFMNNDAVNLVSATAATAAALLAGRVLL